ncbi:Rha family phage regulatory protein [Aeromonas salmonicida]|uniref:Rha family phage regulatory protein n=1 Tax=Aeromonas salmonicida TaxID=645 RepID=UPI0038B8B1E6
MHCFNGMSVVNVKIQLMSGHSIFLSLLACPPVESEVVAPGISVSGQSHHHSASRTGHLVQMGWSYSLLLRGDCLSAVTVAWGESLPQTGRGPALRALISEAGLHPTSWLEVEGEGHEKYDLCYQGISQRQVLAFEVVASVYQTFVVPFICLLITNGKLSQGERSLNLTLCIQAKNLTHLTITIYAVGAAAKSAAGIRTPRTTLEPTHAPIAWFFVGTRPPFTWVLLAYPAIGIYSVMVARAGQPSGWSVSKVADSTNPVRATTMRFVPPVGSDNLPTLEAAIMATVPTPVTPVIHVIDGQAVTTSLDLAAYFGKRHDDVIRKIRSLDCSLEFNARNFAAVQYTDTKGEKRNAYHLTRDGFFFVAMGFTGRRAAEFKEAYIAAFNLMEQQLRQRAMGHLETVDIAVGAVIENLAVIQQAWDEQLYDGLKALGSPLAVSLHDRVHMACFAIQQVAYRTGTTLTMEEARARTQPPAFPGTQQHRLRRPGGRHA